MKKSLIFLGAGLFLQVYSDFDLSVLPQVDPIGFNIVGDGKSSSFSSYYNWAWFGESSLKNDLKKVLDNLDSNSGYKELEDKLEKISSSGYMQDKAAPLINKLLSQKIPAYNSFLSEINNINSGDVSSVVTSIKDMVANLFSEKINLIYTQILSRIAKKENVLKNKLGCFKVQSLYQAFPKNDSNYLTAGGFSSPIVWRSYKISNFMDVYNIYRDWCENNFPESGIDWVIPESDVSQKIKAAVNSLEPIFLEYGGTKEEWNNPNNDPFVLLQQVLGRLSLGRLSKKDQAKIAKDKAKIAEVNKEVVGYESGQENQ